VLFPDHFSAVAASYARYRPTYPAALFDWIASTAPARERAWDCACGSGQATLPLSERFAQVTGTDASAQQLEEAPAHPGITWCVATAESSGLTAASFDVVTVAQALHWLDLPKFWVEVRRVLRRRGLFAAWCYGLATLDHADADARLRDFHDNVVGDYWPRERGHVDRGYRNIVLPFERLDSPTIEMSERWTLDRLLGYIRTWSAVRRYIEAKQVDPVEAFGDTLRRDWGDATRELRWPLTIVAGRVG
jgi:ubiquinone/menaquinone biosynthesis C-methylase UbiE